MVDDIEPYRSQPESQRWFEVPRNTEAPYYCASGKTPQETYEEVYRNLNDLFDHIKTCRLAETMPTLSRLSRWHRHIFQSTFPGSAGRFRSQPCRFGVWLPEGPDYREWPLSSADGADHKEIRNLLGESTEAFRTSLPPQWRKARADEVGESTANLFTEVLQIHPFVDGNMRFSLAVLMGAIRQFQYDSTGLWRRGDFEFAAAYSTALRPDEKQSTEPLAELISRRIQKEP